MPPIREHRILYTFLGDEDAEDGDEEMPPLVEAPAAAAAAQRQTHMQAQEAMMSSIDFSGVTWEAPPFAPPPVLEGEDGEEAQGGGVRGGGRRGGRAGRRAGASYIPRPPNAFILFRSSFIRSQSVPGRVEGNHSTLSKIIGKCWHALSAEERARWEDKARAAQAEHRRRYPDWRFRPGNGKNTFTSGRKSGKPKGRRKGRIKDGEHEDGEDPPDRDKATDGETDDTADGDVDEPERGRRSVKGKERAKGKGKQRAATPGDDEDSDVEDADDDARRLNKISDLVVEGKTGRALEAAVEEWEWERRGRGRARAVSAQKRRRAGSRSSDAEPDLHLVPPFVTPHSPSSLLHPPPHPPQSLSVSPVHTPSIASTSTVGAGSLMLPPPLTLTTMYKRSLSAPCGERVALPSPSSSSSPPPVFEISPVLSPAAAAYPPTLPYFGYAHQPPGHAHVRRDTISSFPVAVPGSGGGYRQYASPRRPERSAYTYPPPYAFAPGPGPPPMYGGEARAQAWWDAGGRAGGSGGDDTEAGAVGDVADEGWVDGGVSSFANAYAPSPSPPLASPFGDIEQPKLGLADMDGAAYPPPLSPLSPVPLSPKSEDSTRPPGPRFRFPPAPPPPATISRFSTLSGWAGDVVVGAPSVSQMQASGVFYPSSSGSGSGTGTGWYKPPGWENSVHGVAASSSAPFGWPTRGDAEMEMEMEIGDDDPGAAWSAH